MGRERVIRQSSKNGFTLALIALLAGLAVMPSRPVFLDTHPVQNSSVSSPVLSPWWLGASSVTQQWGCTTLTLEGTYIPPGYSCPPGVNHWHHGIDVADAGGQHAVNCVSPTTGIPPGTGFTLYSGRAGVVKRVDVPVPQISNHTSDLQIQMADGYFVNLLHVQSVLSSLGVGSKVNVGEAIATVGDDGYPTYATACHLHFEVDQTNVLGDNGGFDVDPTSWFTSVTPSTGMGAMAPLDFSSGTQASANQAFYAFAVRPVDGHLMLNFYSPTSGWAWFDESTQAVSAHPPSVALGGTVAQIGFLDSGGVLRQYAFVGGTNGHLYVDFYSTSGWQWLDQSSLSGAPAWVREVVGTGSFIDNGGARDLYVFVIDNSGALWLNFGNASAGAPQNWQSLSALATPYPAGSPALPSLSMGVGAEAGVSTAGTRALYAFAAGSNGHVYLFVWSDQSNTWFGIDEHIETQFAGVTVAGRLGVDAFVDDSSILRTYAFIIGNTGRVYVNYYDATGTTGWHWSDQGLLNAGATAASVGVGVTHLRKSDGTLNVYAGAIGTDSIIYVNYQGLTPTASWSAAPTYPGLTPYTDVGATGYVSPTDGSQGLYILTTARVVWSNVERDLQLDLWSSSSNGWQALDQGSL